MNYEPIIVQARPLRAGQTAATLAMRRQWRRPPSVQNNTDAARLLKQV